MRGVIRALAGRLPLRPVPRSEAAPLALLLLALSSVFVFGGDRSQFYRPSVHDDISTQTLTLAANLSAEHRFLGFLRRPLDEEGEPEYYPYNRYPIGPYALVGLAILPFGDDFPRAIRAARLLMLALFAAAAALAYLALSRLLGDRRIALAATLLACSSYYLLYHNDMVSSDVADLFGVVLAFHGMAVYEQEGRFRQLLAKTAVAVFLGWHVLALAAPFAVLGLASEAWRARGEGARAALAAAARSRYPAYGAFAVLCAALALGFNLGNEYLALRGEVSPSALPSFESMLRRSGLDAAQENVGGLGWWTFLKGQLGAIGGLAIPYAFVHRFGPDLAQPYYGLWPTNPWLAAPGAIAAAAGLAGLRGLRPPLPAAALLLSGWCWAIAFRGSASFHQFEAMFHLGAAILFWAFALRGLLAGLRRLPGRERVATAAPALAAAAIAVFALSARDMAGVGHGAEAAAFQRAAGEDLRAMRSLTAGRSVLLGARFPAAGTVTRMQPYYLTGAFAQTEAHGPWREPERVRAYEYVVLGADFGGSLTPGNRRLHLYRTAALPGLYASFAEREPLIRAAFDLHFDGRTLTWARGACGEADRAARFLFRVTPLDPADLPPERRAHGFEALGFHLSERGVRHEGWCMAAAALPDYAVLAVRTGQRDARGEVWAAAFAPDPEAWRARYEAVAAVEPSLRAAFDVRVEGRTLHYTREQCAEADAEARFFLHVTPLDASGLPEDRREAGFANLDFAFADRGLRHEGQCLASVPLPGYPIARLATGQFEGDTRLWEGEIAFPAPSG